MYPLVKMHRCYVVGILASTVVLLFGFFYFIKPTTPDPNFLALQAQAKLAQTSSYRFQLSVRTVIDGQDRIVSTISGEFIHPNTYYLKGTSYDYELELYHINNRLIFLDPADKQWKTTPAAPSLVSEAVLFTTSPIADFMAAQDFQLLTLEHANTPGFYGIRTNLENITNPYWEIFFSDFYLESWVRIPSYQVERLMLFGSNPNNIGNDKDMLLIELTLSDHDQPIEIIAPTRLLN